MSSDAMRAPKPSFITTGELSGTDATNELHQTIKQFVTTSDKQARTMIGLTWAIVCLTVIMALGLGLQIWLDWPK